MIAPDQSWGWAEGLWGGSLGRCCLPSCCLFVAVVSGVLWWLYYDYRNDPSTELETEKENVKFLFGYAIFSTAVTVSSILLQAVTGLWLENLNCHGFATIRIIPYFFQIWKAESIFAYSLLCSFVSSLWSSLICSGLCHASALYKQYCHQFCRNAVVFHPCCPVHQLARRIMGEQRGTGSSWAQPVHSAHPDSWREEWLCYTMGGAGRAQAAVPLPHTSGWNSAFLSFPLFFNRKPESVLQLLKSFSLWCSVKGVIAQSECTVCSLWNVCQKDGISVFLKQIRIRRLGFIGCEQSDAWWVKIKML